VKALRLRKKEVIHPKDIRKDYMECDPNYPHD